MSGVTRSGIHRSGDDRVNENPGGSFEPLSSDLDSTLKAYKWKDGDHWARYHFASAVAPRGMVLDFGCGHGLGAIQLAPVVQEYVGVDIDPAAIAWARAVVQSRLPNVRFLTASEFSGLFPFHTFDLVASFEVLEHSRTPKEYLKGLFSNSKLNGGRVILSTPNGGLSEHTPDLFGSPYHVDEFSIDELMSMLKAVAPANNQIRLYKERRRTFLSQFDTLQSGLRRSLWAKGVSGRQTGSSDAQLADGESRKRHLFQSWDQFRAAIWWRITPARIDELRGRDYPTIVVEVDV